MSDGESRRRFWVLEYVNGRQFLGRFNDRWTRTSDLDVAALFSSAAEADNARQALLQEAQDRVNQSSTSWPAPMWWELHGGLVAVTEVEQVTRCVPREPEDDDAPE